MNDTHIPHSYTEPLVITNMRPCTCRGDCCRTRVRLTGPCTRSTSVIPDLLGNTIVASPFGLQARSEVVVQTPGIGTSVGDQSLYCWLSSVEYDQNDRMKCAPTTYNPHYVQPYNSRPYHRTSTLNGHAPRNL